ncbi:MAG: PAC2 family protein [Candidatus Odinarchaeia archaeon]
MQTFYLKKIKPLPEKIKDPLAIIGMPGIANVGKNMVLNTIDSLNADKIFDIFYQDFPAQIVVNREGVINTPSASIYFSEETSINRSVFLITGDFQPSTPKGIYDFSYNIAAFLKKQGVNLIIATGAYVAHVKTDSPRVYVSGTSNSLIKQFLKYSNAVLMDVGVISGANGLIPVLANQRFEIDGVCLLAETNPTVILDPVASKAIVEMLNAVLSLNIETMKLDEQIKKMKELIDDIKSQYQAKKPSSTDTDFQSYIS